MNALESAVLSVVSEKWMTLTCIIDRVKKSVDTPYKDELVHLYCGMLIGEGKVDSIEIETKNGHFYAIRKKSECVEK